MSEQLLDAIYRILILMGGASNQLQAYSPILLKAVYTIIICAVVAGLLFFGDKFTRTQPFASSQMTTLNDSQVRAEFKKRWRQNALIGTLCATGVVSGLLLMLFSGPLILISIGSLLVYVFRSPIRCPKCRMKLDNDLPPVFDTDQYALFMQPSLPTHYHCPFCNILLKGDLST